MLTVIKIVTIFFLLLVIYQDFRVRMITWWYIPLLFLGLLFISLQHVLFGELLKYFIINTSFILLQMIVLTIFYTIKKRKLTNIINKYIGLGDILFFLVLCVGFSPVNFIIFIVSGLILTIICFSIYGIASKKKEYRIPLAGMLAVFLCVVFIIKKINPGLDLFNDATIISYLSGIYGA